MEGVDALAPGGKAVAKRSSHCKGEVRGLPSLGHLWSFFSAFHDQDSQEEELKLRDKMLQVGSRYGSLQSSASTDIPRLEHGSAGTLTGQEAAGHRRSPQGQAELAERILEVAQGPLRSCAGLRNYSRFCKRLTCPGAGGHQVWQRPDQKVPEGRQSVQVDFPGVSCVGQFTHDPDRPSRQWKRKSERKSRGSPGRAYVAVFMDWGSFVVGVLIVGASYTSCKQKWPLILETPIYKPDHVRAQHSRIDTMKKGMSPEKKAGHLFASGGHLFVSDQVS